MTASFNSKEGPPRTDETGDPVETAIPDTRVYAAESTPAATSCGISTSRPHRAPPGWPALKRPRSRHRQHRFGAIAAGAASSSCSGRRGKPFPHAIFTGGDPLFRAPPPVVEVCPTPAMHNQSRDDAWKGTPHGPAGYPARSPLPPDSGDPESASRLIAGFCRDARVSSERVEPPRHSPTGYTTAPGNSLAAVDIIPLLSVS